MKTRVSERAGRRPPIPMSPVDSSFIEAIGYDKEKETIHVRMLQGDTYLYPNMPPARFAAFKRAKSKGTFFGENFQKAKHIRRRRKKKA